MTLISAAFIKQVHSETEEFGSKEVVNVVDLQRTEDLLLRRLELAL